MLHNSVTRLQESVQQHGVQHDDVYASCCAAIIGGQHSVAYTGYMGRCAQTVSGDTATCLYNLTVPSHGEALLSLGHTNETCPPCAIGMDSIEQISNQSPRYYRFVEFVLHVQLVYNNGCDELQLSFHEDSRLEKGFVIYADEWCGFAYTPRMIFWAVVAELLCLPVLGAV